MAANEILNISLSPAIVDEAIQMLIAIVPFFCFVWELARSMCRVGKPPPGVQGSVRTREMVLRDNEEEQRIKSTAST